MEAHDNTGSKASRRNHRVDLARRKAGILRFDHILLAKGLAHFMKDDLVHDGYSFLFR